MPDINIDAITKQVNDFVVETVRDGTKEWLRAATRRVPIWSGMAQGSLLRVGELAGQRLSISPLRTRSRVARGRQLGDARLVVQDGKATMSIRVRVPHYVLQETQNVGVSKTAPWQSFNAGDLAFQDFLTTVKPLSFSFPAKVAARF